MKVGSHLPHSSVEVTKTKQCVICQKKNGDSKDGRKKGRLTLRRPIKVGTSLLEVANPT